MASGRRRCSLSFFFLPWHHRHVFIIAPRRRLGILHWSSATNTGLPPLFTHIHTLITPQAFKASQTLQSYYLASTKHLVGRSHPNLFQQPTFAVTVSGFPPFSLLLSPLLFYYFFYLLTVSRALVMNSLWKAMTSGSIVCPLIKTQPSTICTFLLKHCPTTEHLYSLNPLEVAWYFRKAAA